MEQHTVLRYTTYEVLSSISFNKFHGVIKAAENNSERGKNLALKPRSQSYKITDLQLHNKQNNK